MNPLDHQNKVSELVGKKVPGRPAFPLVYQTGVNDGVPCFNIETGMSLRDWFASMIPLSAWENEQLFLRWKDSAHSGRQYECKLRYAKADAMLEVRSMTPEAH